jgi:hypothetical protein
LDEYDWSWSANAAAPWPAQNPVNAPNGNDVNVTGDAAFPGWTNNSSSINWQ